MDTEKEIWIDVDGYNGVYQCSNFGRARSFKCNKMRILKPVITSYGYYQYSFNGELHRAHRVIASLFIPNPENKPQVNHKNGIKTDNHISNLEWCTAKENMIHKYSAGLYRHSDITKEKISQTSKKRINSKETRDKIKKIILNLDTGIFYIGLEEAAASCGMDMHSFYRKITTARKNKLNYIRV